MNEAIIHPTALREDAPAGENSCWRFARYVEERATEAAGQRRAGRWLVVTLAYQCANVDLRAIWHFRRFWRQLQMLPPTRFGREGFRGEFVDDFHPTRHYCAFLLAGFFLPRPLARLFNRLWERAEAWAFGVHSPRDVRLGDLAVEHGRALRREGPAVLAGRIRSDLCG